MVDRADDEPELAKLLILYNAGCREKTALHIKQIDEHAKSAEVTSPGNPAPGHQGGECGGIGGQATDVNRLSVLEMASELGNVAKACWPRGVA